MDEQAEPATITVACPRCGNEHTAHAAERDWYGRAWYWSVCPETDETDYHRPEAAL